MKPKTPYECIRCGYNTHDKRLMRKHLYERKKPCPGEKNIITLTDDIKNCILDNKRYIITQDPEKNEHQYHIPTPTNIVNNTTTINNYQQITDFISNMDNVDKITKLSEYKNIDLIDFDERVEKKYHKFTERLESDKIDDFKLSFDNIMEIIDNVTSTSNGGEDLNFLYEQYSNKLKIFNDGEWSSTIFEIGVKEIIDIIKTYYLDYYECYLCRQIHNDDINMLMKTKKKEYLTEYYKLLVCFDLQPYIKGKTNNKIMYPSNHPSYYQSTDSVSDFEIEESIMEIYRNIKENIKHMEVNKLKRDINNLIKRNSKSNIIELNRRVMEIIQVDDVFKSQILNSLSRCI